MLFAGGGTGGHIYPNLAVVEALRAAGVAFEPLFVVSSRAIDADILNRCDLPFVALATQPLYLRRPVTWPGFILALQKSKRQMAAVIAQHNVRALVATGGFVSGPALSVAGARGVATAMANLDAVPGKANRRIAPHADRIFSVYDTPALPDATRIGLPLRAIARGPRDVAAARALFSLDPDRQTLMVTGGSQGARSLNETVIELLARPEIAAAAAEWQVLHICGPGNEAPVREGYTRIGFDRAVVMAYCDRMGAAWRSATLAMSRAGAGSVAEAWANAAPTIFWPYPGHKDEHQRLNALPMVEAGGALLHRDTRDAKTNAAGAGADLLRMVTDPDACAAMRRRLEQTQPPDGAAAIAHWVAGHLS